MEENDNRKRKKYDIFGACQEIMADYDEQEKRKSDSKRKNKAKNEDNLE